MKSFKIIILLLLALSFKQVKSQTDSLKIYPNPFTDTLNLQIYLVNNDTVTITVYSVTGQLVKTLAYDSVMVAGNHYIIYNTFSLATGIYFVMMKVGTITTTKKVIKLAATNSIETVNFNVIGTNVFPNPNSGAINLKSSIGLGVITIYNNIGETIYHQTTKENNVQIDLSQQSNGIYFVKTQNQYIKIVKE